MRSRSARWLARRAALAVVAAALMMPVTTGCGGAPTSAPTVSHSATTSPISLLFPSTRAGEQLAWVVRRMNESTPLNRAEIVRHFSHEFLDQVPADDLAVALSQVAMAGQLRFAAVIGPSNETELVARLDSSNGSLRTTIVVEQSAPGRIIGLLFQPYKAVERPADWDEVDDQLGRLAAQASLLAVEVSAETPVHAREAEQAGAIGSAFKLYVLGALASAVEEGSASWRERLAIHNSWKSLPSGDMRRETPGREFTLRHYAEQMIAASDNTATDHLMHRLGRTAIERRLEPMGMAEAERTLPMLTTREMFALKLSAPEALRDKYIAAGLEGRRDLLPVIDTLPLRIASLGTWTSPRDIDTLEWFASPADLVEALVYLHNAAQAQGLRPLRTILGRNPGIGLDAETWSYAAFKGGSEPGVLSLAWLLERHDGRTFALAIVLNDPSHDIDQAAAVGLAEGAVSLLAEAP